MESAGTSGAGTSSSAVISPEPQRVQNAINASAIDEQGRRLADLSVEEQSRASELLQTGEINLQRRLHIVNWLFSQNRNQSGNAEPWMRPIPVHVVTNSAELPVSFLQPNPNQQLVIGFDCEGVELARYGRLCVMQLAFKDAVYLVDAVVGGDALIQACKLGLESPYVKKICHDCKRDSEALYFQYNIKLNNVFDSQIAYTLLEEQHGNILKSDHISFVNLLADGRYCGVDYDEKEEVRDLLKKDPQFWTHRPWNEMMKRVAADDVRFLLHIHDRMSESLTELSKWRLSVRSSLYCRCFCSVDANFQAWPFPPFTGEFVDGKHPQYEVLTVIDVPPGKMGRVIGIRGDSIRNIKKSFRCNIFIEKLRGPPDKIFVIGTADEVVKAKRLLDTIVGRSADTVMDSPSYHGIMTPMHTVGPSYHGIMTPMHTMGPSYHGPMTSMHTVSPSSHGTMTSMHTASPSYHGTMTSMPTVRLGPPPNRGIKIIDPQTGAEIKIPRR